MTVQRNVFTAFNRGVVSPLGFARTEVKRLALGAETMTNWLPRVLGAMSIRPGLQYIGATQSNAVARMIPFRFSVAQRSILEFTDSLMRVWTSDALVTRPSVTSTLSNGNPFVAGLTSWTDDDESGATSSYNGTKVAMELVGNGTSLARRYQTVTVAGANIGVVHSLAINILRGPVTIRVGSTTTNDSYVGETTLQTGYHNIAFTPTGNFTVVFQSRLKRSVFVKTCAITAAGTMTLVSPFVEADLDDLRYDQSGDIVFIACKDKRQMEVQRRSNDSWSLVYYYADDGPFRDINTSTTTITPSALSGNITLTASASVFRSTNVGSLFRISSTGQRVTANIAAAVTTFTSAIRVTGVTTNRAFTYIITGRTASTITLRRSLESSTGPWVTVATYVADATATYSDGLDNQIAWYSIGVNAADYGGADNIDVTLSYNLGSISGVCRITDYTSETSVSAEVITDLGNTSASSDWYEGSWSDRRIWPTAVAFHEGRLWWAGDGELWGSVSDAYTSFSDSVTGTTGTINRLIAAGGTDTIQWMISGQRLVVGSEGTEMSARSSSLDEPLTPTAFTLRGVSNQGSGPADAVKADTRIFFIGRTLNRVFEMDFNAQQYDYQTDDMTKVCPELGLPTLIRLAVQRQPDTRVIGVRSDGAAIFGIFDKAEDVLCWCKMETDGVIEDVVTFPASTGENDDNVYFVVKRTINGSTVRYIEKMAQEDECTGGALTYLADSFVTYTGTATTAITGLSHLEGEEVCVWANGVDVGTDSSYEQTYTVASGQITLAEAATNVVVGLPYTAQWKSVKIGSVSASGISPLGFPKIIDHVSLILANTHTQGLRFGPDFSNLDGKPQWEDGNVVPEDQIDSHYDTGDIEFPGTWTPDARMCLQAQAPRPCTVLGVAMLWTISR